MEKSGSVSLEEEGEGDLIEQTDRLLTPALSPLIAERVKNSTAFFQSSQRIAL